MSKQQEQQERAVAEHARKHGAPALYCTSTMVCGMVPSPFCEVELAQAANNIVFNFLGWKFCALVVVGVSYQNRYDLQNRNPHLIPKVRSDLAIDR